MGSDYYNFDPKLISYNHNYKRKMKYKIGFYRNNVPKSLK